MKMMAVKGNNTTTGGYVLNGDPTALDHGQPIARHHDQASCGQCGENGLIEGTAETFGLGSMRGVCDGDIVMCRCPRGANRVIAQSTLYYKD
ncbi:PAAR domain-containing protein [Burkholderia sp. L27(2015)]|uniref:PAAR domain-containing protein n=1 Tax=Burkholderia sp. L27(2015) TaxID=1641858 RepID=UPI00131DE790|nr:PAAR domain-containing protein [Burkholderia sp. L27(2015)]